MDRKEQAGLRDGGGDKGASQRVNPAAKSLPGDVGSALRSAYEQTMREDIPADLLDLLGKLS